MYSLGALRRFSRSFAEKNSCVDGETGSVALSIAIVIGVTLYDYTIDAASG